MDSQKISCARAVGKVDKRQMIIVGSPNLGRWHSSAVERKRAAPQRRSKDVGVSAPKQYAGLVSMAVAPSAKRRAAPQCRSKKEGGASAP